MLLDFVRFGATAADWPRFDADMDGCLLKGFLVVVI